MKEIVLKLLDEQEHERKEVQQKMNRLIYELEKQNELIEKMKRHTGKDENIFSPRVSNVITTEEIQKEIISKESIEEEIESTSEKIEKILERQNEIKKTLEELEREKTSGKENLEKENLGKENLEKKKLEKSEKEIDEIIEKLREIAKSADLALALLNGDKNKCKNELKKIKNYVKQCMENVK